MLIVEGNLLEAKVDVIAHQINCVTLGPNAKGIAKTIHETFPFADIYTKREITEEKTEFGKAYWLKGDESFKPVVLAITGQYFPGKPATVGGRSIDTAENRLKMFEKALNQVKIDLKENGYKSIAFPYLIGCGLAQGNWDDYKNLIHDFSIDVKNDLDVQVYVYKLT
jgi:O-acetyl-ADP-ribose deacetylase (regulator of RNase III)